MLFNENIDNYDWFTYGLAACLRFYATHIDSVQTPVHKPIIL